jgi:hypothetical protein
VSTAATNPPERPSNEATDEQLRIAREEGDAYGKAVAAMAADDTAVTRSSGDYLVAFVNEDAEGMYELAGGQLVWREAAPEATVHLEVAVADAGDGRFVPGLSVHVDVERDGDNLVCTDLPLLWHPFLYHYGGNAKLPDSGPYDVVVRIEAPTFMRHDPVNGKRYESPVQVRFDAVRFAHGRKLSPDAQPRGADASTAGPSSTRRGHDDWADAAAQARTASDEAARAPHDSAGVPSLGGSARDPGAAASSS